MRSSWFYVPRPAVTRQAALYFRLRVPRCNKLPAEGIAAGGAAGLAAAGAAGLAAAGTAAWGLAAAATALAGLAAATRAPPPIAARPAVNNRSEVGEIINFDNSDISANNTSKPIGIIA